MIVEPDSTSVLDILVAPIRFVVEIDKLYFTGNLESEYQTQREKRLNTIPYFTVLGQIISIYSIYEDRIREYTGLFRK